MRDVGLDPIRGWRVFQNMKYAPCIIVFAALLLCLTSAHAKPTRTFSKEQSFKSCSESTMLACGKIDSSGRRYGTAHTRTMCSTYTFQPDGTARFSEYPGMWDAGRYEVRGGSVFIETLDPTGKVVGKRELKLSKDGKTLGGMKLMQPSPAP